jgi:hypothetical protein
MDHVWTAVRCTKAIAQAAPKTIRRKTAKAELV